MQAYIVQVNTGKGWRKRRDIDPQRDFRYSENGEIVAVVGSGLARAERLAASCESAPRRSSCSDGYPHRVVEVSL